MPRRSCLSAILLLALAGCGDPSPKPPENRIGDAGGRGDVLPVMGPERRIVVLASGPISGTGEQSYAGMLQAALRVRGINARVVPMVGVLPSPPPDLAVADTADPTASVYRRRGIAMVQADFGAVLKSAPGQKPAGGAKPGVADIEDMVAATVEQVARALPPLASPTQN